MNSLAPLFSDWFAPRAEARTQLTVGVRLIVFAALLVAFFPVVWFLCDILQPQLTKLLASAAQLPASFTNYSMRFRTSGSGIYFAIIHRRALEAWVDTKPVFANLPILLTMVAVTPGLRWRRRLAYVFGAGALLFVTHLCFLWIKVEVTLISAGHPDAGSPALWQTLDDLFEVTGKTFFPVLIWLLLAFPYMLGSVDLSTEKIAPGQSRNALCPCGSGKKFKRCCGR